MITDLAPSAGTDYTIQALCAFTAGCTEGRP